MASDLQAIRALYKRLLGLYPQEFRKRLGESMEQTFSDLCNEQRQRTEQGIYMFLLWIFVETAVGIVKEHALSIKEGDTMKTIAKDLGLASGISFMLMLPFAILESLNNTITKQNAPGLILLFGILWLLPTVFIVILMPIVRAVRGGNGILLNPVSLLFKVVFLAVIASIWGWGFMDQLPCFLGVPNCD